MPKDQWKDQYWFVLVRPLDKRVGQNLNLSSQYHQRMKASKWTWASYIARMVGNRWTWASYIARMVGSRWSSKVTDKRPMDSSRPRKNGERQSIPS